MPPVFEHDIETNPRRYLNITVEQLKLYQTLLNGLLNRRVNRKQSANNLPYSILKGDQQVYILSKRSDNKASFLGHGRWGKTKVAAALTLTENGYVLSPNVFAVKRFFNEPQDYKTEYEIFKKVYGFAELIEIDDKKYMVMQKFPGHTLHSALISRYSLPQIVDLITALTKSAIRLTSLNVAYVDLCMSNTIYDANKKVAHYIDFGNSYICKESIIVNKAKLYELVDEIFIACHKDLLFIPNPTILKNVSTLTYQSAQRIVDKLWNINTNQIQYDSNIQKDVSNEVAVLFLKLKAYKDITIMSPLSFSARL